MKDNVKNKSLEIVNLFMGVAMVCAVFTFSGSPAAVVNAAIVGSIIAMCSLLVLYRYQDWAEWTNLLAGSWAIIAPFVLGFGSLQAPMLTHVVVGISVATISLMQLRANRKPR